MLHATAQQVLARCLSYGLVPDRISCFNASISVEILLQAAQEGRDTADSESAQGWLLKDTNEVTTESSVPDVRLQNPIEHQASATHIALESPIENESTYHETPQSKDQDDTNNGLNVHTWKQSNIPDATFSLSLFYENYKPRCWFWEVTEMYRKLVLMSGLVFIGSHSCSQVGIGLLLSGIFAILHAAFRPIADKFEDMLQTIALLVIFFDLSLGVMLKTSGEDIPSE